MLQIVFNEISAAEISQLGTLEQLELLDEFKVSEQDLENLEDDRFGSLERDGKRLYRFRSQDYRFYFEVADDEWIKVLDDSDDWDFDQEGEPGEEYWEFTTEGDRFEIPECVGGKHAIVICNDDLGSSADEDEVDDAKEVSRDFTVEPTIEVLSVNEDEIDDPDDAEGPMGTVVEVKGTGFGEDEEVEVYFDGELVRKDGEFVDPALNAGLTAGAFE